MFRMSSATKLNTAIAMASLSLTFVVLAITALAQNPYDRGTPVEARGGSSWFSAYAPDKVETVNLANGNLMANIPLATVGGRGQAAYTISLSYHNKLWTSRHDPEVISDPFGGQTIIHHFRPDFGDGVQTLPNELSLGGGWFILKAPAIKSKKFGIDARRNPPYPGWYKYVLTKLWVVLPDGSEIELRDEATQGAPALAPTPDPVNDPLTDRDRGRIWKSVDGSAITYINDTNISGVNFALNGWVLMPDGTRFRVGEVAFGGGSARCSKIIDRNGNYINIAYDTPVAGAVTYTDQLGRQVILQGGTGGATVTIKGYNGVADRVYTVQTARIGALDGSGNPTNMRSDYWSVQRPIIAGDFVETTSGILHNNPNPHTDLFNEGENGIVIDDIVTPTKLILPNGNFFTFRYDKYASLAEIVYPTGGKTQIDYAGSLSEVCEVLSAPYAFDVNRKVTQRRVFSDGVTVDSVWVYGSGDPINPASSFEVRQGSSNGPLLMSEAHYFMALNAEYRRCYSFGNDSLDYGSDGTMNPKWENAKEYKVERQTGSGIVTELKNWAQRTPVVWAPDPGSGSNAYAVQFGQEQPANDDRVTREDAILENGKLKRTEYGYDNFNNVISVKEYDFGSNPNPGPLVRETVRSYATNLNGFCYSNLNPTDPNCGSGIVADINSIIHMRRLPLQESIRDENNAEKARVNYEYDVYSSDGSHAPLTGYTTVTMHDAGWGISRLTRGNVTKTTRWLLAITGPAMTDIQIVSYPQYDMLGNVVKTKDPKGNTTEFKYDDTFCSAPACTNTINNNTFAYLTKTILPISAAQTANGLSSKYDFSTGLVVKTIDANDQTTSFEYNDPLFRVTRIVRPLGGGDTEYLYGDAPGNLYLQTLTKQSPGFGGVILQDYAFFDGLGRAKRSAHQEKTDFQGNPTEWSVRENVYDSLGRISQVSNQALVPGPTDPLPGGTGWTTTTYDALSRVTEVTTPDNAKVKTTYLGNQVTVEDQANRKRSSVTDGLGRLIQVNEAPNDPTNYNYQTNYTYDTLGNLIRVRQGGFPTGGSPDPTVQFRRFYYDSLSRLVYANNPEQNATIAFNPPGESGTMWTMAYVYDNNGNLTGRTDARNVTTTYSYDALNRNTTVNYSNTPNISPDIERFYDTATNGKGRLQRVVSNLLHPGNASRVDSQTIINAYDNLGRVTSQSQQFRKPDNTWYGFPQPITRTYDLASHVVSQVYPSGNGIFYGYNAGGRSANSAGALAGEGNTSYYDSMKYNAAGQLTEELLWQFLYHRMDYNNRFQMTETRVSTNPTDPLSWDLGKLRFFYNLNAVNNENPALSGTDNNGNVLRQEHFVPTQVQNVVQGGNTVKVVTQYAVPMRDDYSYDPINRITQVKGWQWTTDMPTPEQIYQQTYSYDKFGNRKLNKALTWGMGINGSVAADIYDVDKPTNRLKGMIYDAAGNLVKTKPISPQPENRVYDAENRMITATLGATSHYVYDGDGRRVRRILPTGEFWQVYGIDGELLAEYQWNNPTASLKKEYGYRDGQLLVVADPTEVDANKRVQWLIADHLGTPRMVVDKTGGLSGVTRHDYLPFGEELMVGIGSGSIRSTGMGYAVIGNAADSVRQKFTGKERDIESGQDFFLARYSFSIHGRFTSPDPYNPVMGDNEEAIAVYANQPQHWNKYSYALNQPTRFVDPDGENPLIVGGALIGGIIGGGAKYIELKAQGKPADWQKIGAAFVGGAITGGLAGATGGASLGTQLLVGSGASTYAGVLERIIDGDPDTRPDDGAEILKDAVGGVFGGLTGGKVAGRPFETAIRISEPFDIAYKTARNEFRRMLKYGSQAGLASAKAKMRFVHQTVPLLARSIGEQSYGKITEYPSKFLVDLILRKRQDDGNTCGQKGRPPCVVESQ